MGNSALSGTCAKKRAHQGSPNLKKDVADDLRSIFYASSRKKADEFAVTFAAKWEKELPSATKCLANSLDACLTSTLIPKRNGYRSGPPI